MIVVLATGVHGASRPQSPGPIGGFSRQEVLVMDSFNRLAAHLASISPQPYRRGTPDIRVEDHGSIVLLRPATTAGREWLEAHCDQSGYQPFSGGTLLCEPRYVANIVRRAIEDGLEVE
jgi:hypothetical protein